MRRMGEGVWKLLFGIAMVLLAACAGAPAAMAPTAAPAPTAAAAPQAPTDAPAATTAPASITAATATTAPATNHGPLSDTNPAKPDDTTQGRLRISNCVASGPSVALMIDGKLTVNAGVVQQEVPDFEYGVLSPTNSCRWLGQLSHESVPVSICV